MSEQMQQEEQHAEREAQRKRAAEGAVKQRVTAWAGGKGIVAMLQTLHLALAERVQPIEIGSSASKGEVRKAYMKVRSVGAVVRQWPVVPCAHFLRASAPCPGTVVCVLTCVVGVFSGGAVGAPR